MQRGTKHKRSTKIKMRNAKLGRKHSKETIAKISKARKMQEDQKKR